MALFDRIAGVIGRKFFKMDGFVSIVVTEKDTVRVEFRESMLIEVKRATGQLDKLPVPKPGLPETIEIPLSEVLKFSNLFGGKKPNEQRGQISEVSGVSSTEPPAS